MGRRHCQLLPIMPSRPTPRTPAAWVDEVLAVATLDPLPDPCQAAVAARGWSVSRSFIGSLAALSAEDAARLAEVWEEPAEMPGAAGWAAWYLAGQIHLGHLSPADAVAVMIAVVTHLGGTAVSVSLPDSEPVDTQGYTQDYRGRC